MTSTRLSSNDESALELLGSRPSLERVWNAAWMAANWPIVVPEASSIVWISLWSVWRAVSSVRLDVDVDVVPVVKWLRCVSSGACRTRRACLHARRVVGVMVVETAEVRQDHAVFQAVEHRGQFARARRRFGDGESPRTAR